MLKMLDRLILVLTFLAALGSGLLAGVFFAFSSFIMKGLARLVPSAGIAAMQSINITVINPVFMAVFVGTAIIGVVLAVVSFLMWREVGGPWLLAGSLLYVLGSFVVTLAFNVPLNDAVAAVDPASAEGAALWSRYLSSWTGWNHVRMVASLAALAAYIPAICGQLRGLASG
jgi:uncharacterized membrane protein